MFAFEQHSQFQIVLLTVHGYIHKRFSLKNCRLGVTLPHPYLLPTPWACSSWVHPVRAEPAQSLPRQGQTACPMLFSECGEWICWAIGGWSPQRKSWAESVSWPGRARLTQLPTVGGRWICLFLTWALKATFPPSLKKKYNHDSLCLDFLLFLSWGRGQRGFLGKEDHFRSPRAILGMFQKSPFHFMGTRVSGKIMPSVWLVQLVGLVKSWRKKLQHKGSHL